MSISTYSPLCLGSGSPRRRELLSGLGLSLRIVIPATDEDALAGEHPLAYLERVALDKLRAVASMKEKVEGTSALLVADTIVRVKDEIIGKPRDKDDAYVLLQKICGREHIVHTRYAISFANDFTNPIAARTVTSRVWLRGVSPAVLRRYADTGEGLDKAGAYAVQGIGSFLVDRIEGSYSNVVGLPVSDVVADLMNAGLLEDFP